MSVASETFGQSIQDAENLLVHFNTLNTRPPPAENEVLKRAGLIMAMTAWETYVEDRLQESAVERLRGVADELIAGFVQAKLDEEIRRLHNPNSAKTVQLFNDYAGVDLKKCWSWNNHDEKSVRESLDRYVKLRGDVVHRSRPVTSGPPQAHPVKKEDLERVIRFLKQLVEKTESAFERTGK
jgi:hypothetical protein